MSLKSDLISAGMLLTRLPLRGTPTPRAADAAWAWPLAGLVVAGLAAGIGLAASALGAAPGLAAAITLTCLVMATGAMHEDGLADMADGVWGGFTPARRLEIMRDSRIGTYGVIALVLSLLVRWLLLSEALQQGSLAFAAIGAAMASRATLPMMMIWLPQARSDGLSHGTGTPTRRAAAMAAALGLAGLLLQGPATGLLAMLAGGAAAMGVGWVAKAKLGGQTGDVLGAAQQMAEIAILAVLVAR